MARLLVVDDDTEAAFILGEILRTHYEVTVLTQSMEALEVVRSQPIDLLLTDLCMPAVDGFGLIEAVRVIRPRLPIIIISAYYDDSEVLALRMAKRHADAIFAKPVRREDLKRTIDRLLELPTWTAPSNDSPSEVPSRVAVSARLTR